MGWVLDHFGLGNGHEGETAGIRDQLGQIQNDLTEVLAATRELRAEVAQSEYSLMVSETSRITARIDKGMDDLDAVAKMAKDDPTRKGFTEATLTFIGDELMKGQQEELAKRITGEAGSDGLIVAASKVAKTRSPCCWTARTSEHVRRVLTTTSWRRRGCCSYASSTCTPTGARTQAPKSRARSRRSRKNWVRRRRRARRKPC